MHMENRDELKNLSLSKVGLLHVPRPMNNFCVTHVSFFMKFMGAKNENEFHNAVNQMTPKSDNGIRREGFTTNINIHT